MSFLASLPYRDLQRLRTATRRIHFQYTHEPFDPKEADKLIEAMGPEIVERLLRKAVEDKL